ncbi:MAG: hypothetical protein Q7R79_03720 [bacterium]|nr:hypothetical protein [bacterium]
MEIIRDIITKIFNAEKLVPIASGAISIKLLVEVIHSKLEGEQYFVAIASSLFIFFISVIAFVYLSKIEKDKDTEMLEAVKRIIEAVFKHFGVAMANKDAASTASTMNPLMQSIVNLAKEFQKLAEKSYKN